MAHELPCFLSIAAGFVLSEYGHERLRKRAFRKQPAQKVGNTERYKESIRLDSGAEGAGDEHIAHEPQNSGYQRHAADGDKGFEQIHGRVCYPNITPL